ncbi:hypothetical protein CYK66_09150 [Clostridium perfringens]|nr:hypothetical protein CYK66_09150 [Clostridium perfringens]
MCKIKVFAVNSGDCISIKYKGSDGKYHNIFIDCGFARTFASTLEKEVIDIKSNGEKIDLFILTHTHKDHIGGISEFIKKYGTDDIVDKYWFNGGRLLLNLDKSPKISINQGYELEKYLIENKNGNEDKIVFKRNNEDIFGAEICVIGPNEEVLNKFLSRWNKDYSILSEKISTSLCDWGIDISDFNLETFDEDDCYDNKSSIVLLFAFNNKKILLLGDSAPSEVVKSLKSLGYSKENRLKLEYLKVSHHASRGNTSNELLEIIDCNKFIISTNGANSYKFPHKETFARILRHELRDINKKLSLSSIMTLKR